MLVSVMAYKERVWKTEHRVRPDLFEQRATETNIQTTVSKITISVACCIPVFLTSYIANRAETF